MLHVVNRNNTLLFLPEKAKMTKMISPIIPNELGIDGLWLKFSNNGKFIII